jgi:hypothetical protein
MQQKRSKIPPRPTTKVAAVGTIDDAYRYLTQVVGLQDDIAVYELNQKLAQGRLQLHYRRTDTAGLGQAGDVPSESWASQLLRVALNRHDNAEHGPLDWATGKIAAANDGRAFVQLRVAQNPGQTYELTLSMIDVRLLWPDNGSAAAQPPAPATRTSADFAALTPRVQLVVRALDRMEGRGIAITGMPKLELLERLRQQIQSMSPGTTASRRTLSSAEAYRFHHAD